MRYTVFVDESGETGVYKVRNENTPGASPYFVMGAAVLQPASSIVARKRLLDFKSTIAKSKWKHATDLAHNEKVLLARTLGKLPVRYFAVISNKATLKEYKDQIGADPHKFYNKCLKYLLERILEYLSTKGLNEDDLSVILERRNHDYDAMIRYFETVKHNPMYRQSKVFSNFNPFCITTRQKGEEDLLEIADFVSHAVYQLANKTQANFAIPEPRYFCEMSSRFAGDEKCNILGTGIKCIHSLAQLDLDDDVAKLLRDAKCQAAASYRNHS
ncbi:DUF3800 domain-containing protein [Mameliella sp. CS4]|uniref:DUF3800 domain-containing protein n=1 Tax=Mameliella sp. CS4 TaxID=2862329 RepID=UPI001C5F32E2|nr:DUF3800 domain-containing protein [Mameliella sp. CS4]MBW4982962.1 DUF3800 domain-containing protein [Mameliella sp. CS4]